MLTVAVVVVSRNRPELLKQCIAAIDAQTCPVSHIVVVDNASDAPTRDLLAAEVARRDRTFQTILLEENTGAAGGFHTGIQTCLCLPCTHMWLMDDDCKPDPSALAELVAATSIVGEDAVLGGNVFDRNGESINVQPVTLRVGANGVPQFPLHLAEGLLEVAAISFVSFFLPADLARKAGLPLKEFFLWGDDHEYCLRLASFTRFYQVGKSKTTHLKSGDASLRIFKERDYNKIWQYRWLYRNRFYIDLKYYGLFSTEMARLIFNSIKHGLLSIWSGEFILMKCGTILSGLFAGVGFSIQMAMKDSLDRLPNQRVKSSR